MSSIKNNDYERKLSDKLCALTTSYQGTRNVRLNDSAASSYRRRFNGLPVNIVRQPPPPYLGIWSSGDRTEYSPNPRIMRDIRSNSKPTSSFASERHIEHRRPAGPENRPPKEFAGSSNVGKLFGCYTKGARKSAKRTTPEVDIADNCQFLSFLSFMTEFHFLYSHVAELKIRREELQQLFPEGHFIFKSDNVNNIWGFNVCLHVKVAGRLLNNEYSVMARVVLQSELFDDYELYEHAQQLLIEFSTEIAELEKFENYNVEQHNGVMRKKDDEFDKLKSVLVSTSLFVRCCSSFFHIMVNQIIKGARVPDADRRLSFIG